MSKESKGSKKFDVVIGNPPYQEMSNGGGKQPAIYNKFMDESYNIADKVCLITPARFLFNAGATPKKWNRKMLTDEHLKVIHYEQDSSVIFSNTDIMGGVAITYRDLNYDYSPINVFVPNKQLKSILDKTSKVDGDLSISSILYGGSSYRYDDLLFNDFPEFRERLPRGSWGFAGTSSFDNLPEIFLDEMPDDGEEYLRILGRQNGSRVYKYALRKYFNAPKNVDNYKVFLPSANGSGSVGEVDSTPVIGIPTIGSPKEGHTQTFISFGKCDTLEDAQRLLKYVKSKFARVMLSVLKVTQHNATEHVWSKVPLQDFTEDSDIDWSKTIPEIDQQLYKKYNLNEEEIAFIEENVKEMD